jgi:hypothetical protein
MEQAVEKLQIEAHRTLSYRTLTLRVDDDEVIVKLVGRPGAASYELAVFRSEPDSEYHGHEEGIIIDLPGDYCYPKQLHAQPNSKALVLTVGGIQAVIPLDRPHDDPPYVPKVNTRDEY